MPRIKPALGAALKKARGGMPTTVASATGDRRAKMQQLFKKETRPIYEGRKVLLWVPGGMPLMLHVEGAIAAALRLRGVEVHAVICDGPFDACVRREITDGMRIEDWDLLCGSCRRSTSGVLDELGVPHSFIGDFLSPEQSQKAREISAAVSWDDVDDLASDGLPIGANVKSAVIRYGQGQSFDGDERLVREYAYSALMVADAARKAIETFKPDRILMSHAIYVDWGPALKVALEVGVPVTGWMASYLPSRFYLRHLGDSETDFHSMSDEAWADRDEEPLSSDQAERVTRFVRRRYEDAVSFDMKEFRERKGDAVTLRKKYGISGERPVWGVLCHINWDQVADYAPMLHRSFDEWVLDTLDQLLGIPDVDWLIKIHPAEVWDNPVSGTETLIAERFDKLPENIRIVGARDDISPLDFYELVDGGVTVYGTAGLELSMLGKPVVLAGSAHYGGKGFTHDARDLEEYHALLRDAPALAGLDEAKTSTARKYAYSYFIQRQIPLPVVQNPASKWWSFQIQRRETLIPGRDPFTDLICERILDGRDFILDEPLVRSAERFAG
jgi:hypothetical protein